MKMRLKMRVGCRIACGAAFAIVMLAGREAQGQAKTCGIARHRGCCAGESTHTGPCEAGLLPIPCAESKYEPGRCSCTFVECLDLSKMVDHCWLRDDAPPATQPMLSLYVTGFNHSSPPANVNRTVPLEGVEELRDRIVSHLPTAAEQYMVVAFSAIGEIGKYPGLLPGEHCDEGVYAGAGNGSRHAGCLANMLEKSYGDLNGGPRFHVAEWENDTKGPGGFAVVTGSYWRPVETSLVRIPRQIGGKCDEGCCVEFFRVRLQSAAPADNPIHFVLYVAHTEGSFKDAEPEYYKRCPNWQPEREVTPPTVLGDLRAIMAYATKDEKPGDLPPLLVGDFNWNLADEVIGEVAPSFYAVDYEVTCHGTTQSLRLEDDVMHVFAGKIRSADAPRGFASQRSLSEVRSFRAIGATYTNYLETTLYPKAGIHLPHVDHNVVALDLELISEPQPPQPPPMTKPCGCGAEGGRASGVVVAVLAVMLRRRRPRASSRR